MLHLWHLDTYGDICDICDICDMSKYVWHMCVTCGMYVTVEIIKYGTCMFSVTIMTFVT